MTISSPILFDTNILVSALDIDSPLFGIAQKLHDQVEEGKIQGFITQQNLIELLAVTTDPKRMKRPLGVNIAIVEIEKYLSSQFQLISPKEETVLILMSLLKKYPVKGQRVFDVYLTATMLSNNIFSIVTANTKDFKGFPGIKIFDIMDL